MNIQSKLPNFTLIVYTNFGGPQFCSQFDPNTLI